MNALHSNESAEHYTPEYVVTAAHKVLGGIDLDPASSELANTVVKAEIIYTADDDGLELDWAGRVFLNPPGNTKTDKKRPSKPVRFWRKLIQHYTAGDVESSIYIGFSLEQLQQIQRYCEVDPLMFPICVPKKRIPFDRPTEEGGILTADEKGRVGSSGPTHANFISYLPPLDDTELHLEAFSQVFGELGRVVIP